ncbi:Drug/metabolite transporter [Macleaya cordata]|uniref:WAT1-related protein n=1 Tax=Macleaya cordata TaxID=56857 RepID=A0A200RD93_MACCD|nr:Drug/metabolite transporter [Macleaya cordata]
MENQGTNNSFFRRCKPYIAMISLQFGYAGMNIITKVSLNRGMSHYVLVVYRHAFATVAIAPFAIFLERKIRPKMTFPIFMQIFVLALLGPVIDQNFYYAGLKFTSPTFSCAMSNMLPAMTFVMAVLCRMEKVDIKKVRCQAKVVGTIVTVAGAMLMTLYKGPIMEMVWSKHIHPRTSYINNTSGSTDKDWFKGSILLIIATLAWAALFILQAITLKRYPAHLSLTTLICFVGTLQSIAVTLVMEHKPSAWSIGWDMNLLAAAYAGIVSSSIAYYVQGLVMRKRGPVFVTAFSPLMMIIVAIMGSFILAEKIYLGGILGAVLIVAGLYSVLWGKYKEFKEKEVEIPEAIKGVEENGKTSIIDDIETGKNIEMQKEEATKPSSVTVTVNVPVAKLAMAANEAANKA